MSPLGPTPLGLGASFAETALSGPLLAAVAVAAVAGLVSFASPCVLPLVPGYLGYVTGLSGVEPARGARQARGRVLTGAALFVAGFSAVFVAYGAAFGALGTALVRYGEVTTRVLGVVVVAMGLLFLGAGRLLPARLGAALDADRRPAWRPAAGLAGAPLLGVVFGLGWSPCLGPTLAAVQALALDAASPWRGVALGLAYCLGLGLPFLLAAAGLGRGSATVAVLRRHRVALGRAGGALLVVVGLLLVTGAWSTWLARLQATVTGFEVAL
jgi:cytochrome c-type biogenesis protein